MLDGFKYDGGMPVGAPRIWVHGIITLRGWWLPGDARGFRNREHRIHSSGDYRNPPPPGEHAALLRYNRARSARVVPLSPVERERAGTALVKKLRSTGSEVLVVACGRTHTHLLFSLVSDDALLDLGSAKQASAHAVGREEGRLWGRGGGVDRVRDRAHQVAVFRYIERHRSEGAWVWTFRDGAP